MRWKDQRCVSQSCRFAIVVCAFWFYFRFVYSTIHFSSHFSSQVQQSYLAQHNQVSVFFGWSRYNIITLKYLKYFMSVQIYIFETIMSPGYYERDFFGLVTWRKWKLFVCPFTSILRTLPILVITSKNQISFMNNWKKKVLHQK